MFNWSDNISLPKLTDAFNFSEFPPRFLQVFTYIWVWFLGAWFFAGVIGVIGAALYIKYDNAMPSIVFFILSILLLGGTGGIFFAETTTMPDAGIFVYIIGLFVSIAIGITLYMLFVSKRE